jgi:glycosyltransferase involved in cell wall biosynthesis
MRVALFAPVSPAKTALADIVEGMLPYWAQMWDLTVVTDGSYVPSHPIFQDGSDPHVPWISYEAFRQQTDGFDIVVYHLGDEPYIHGYMFDALMRYPGVVALHDLVLHHAIVELTLPHKDIDVYLDELRYSYGWLAGPIAWNTISTLPETALERLPLVKRMLDSSLGVICFNRYMQQQVQRIQPDVPTCRIPYPFHLPAGFPSDFDAAAFRRSLGFEDKAVIASFGFFTMQKRLEVALRAFKRLRQRHPDAVYLLVGGSAPSFDLRAEIDDMGLGEGVHLMGYQPHIPFTKYMLITDVAMNLRYPHVGGTPYTPFRLLGLGVPTIISDIEPLRDLPEDVVIRVGPEQPLEETSLFAALDYLLTHPAAAHALGERSRDYVSRQHAASDVSAQHVRFVTRVAQRQDDYLERMVRRKHRGLVRGDSNCSIVNVTSRALVGMGIVPSDVRAIESVLGPVSELNKAALPRQASDR